MRKQSLRSNEVHLWSASLDVCEVVYDVLMQNLSLDEWRRADKFVFEQDRRHFIVARGIIRNILANYLDCQPRDIGFQYKVYGKPELRFLGSSVRLEFNLSHSHGFLVLAVCVGRQVGVDVEHVRPLTDLDHMATISFSDYEQNVLLTLAPEKKLLIFYNCWTRKEAYLKALGSGLMMPLDAFDMSLSPDNPIGMLANSLDPNEVSRWSFFTFVPKHGFVGALAVEGMEVIIQFKGWEVT